MTDEEIQEIVNRLERAVEFRTAKSHIEQLEIEDHLRVRANRDGCLSFAAAFLHAAIEQPNGQYFHQQASSRSKATNNCMETLGVV